MKRGKVFSFGYVVIIHGYFKALNFFAFNTQYIIKVVDFTCELKDIRFAQLGLK